MFGVSLFELIIIMIVVLLVFGPDKLPEVARNLGKVMGELKKHSDAMRREFYNSVYTPTQEINSKIDYAARELRTLAFKDENSDPPNCEEKKRREEEEAAQRTADVQAAPAPLSENQKAEEKKDGGI